MAALSLYARFHYVFTVGVQWLAEAILAEGHALVLSETCSSCKYLRLHRQINNEIFGQNSFAFSETMRVNII